LLVIVPTLVATWYGGLGPGLVSAALSTAAVEYFVSERPGLTMALRVMMFGSESVIAALLMSSVRSSRLRAQASAQRGRAIYEMSAALGAATSTCNVVDVILHQGLAGFDAIAAAVFLTSDSRGPLRLVGHKASTPRVAELMQSYKTLPADSDFPAAVAARERKVIHSSDRRESDSKFPSLRELVAQGFPAAFLFAPMLVGDRLAGVLGVSFAGTRPFDAEYLGWADTLARDCGMALERTVLLAEETRTRIEAQRASRAKDEFLATVSRALRAPLVAITEGARALRAGRGGQGDRERFGEALDRMGCGVQAESRVVDGLLALSQIAAHELRVDRRPVDLVRLVRSCTNALEEKAASSGVHLNTQLQGKATVTGDAGRLEEVVSQLITNALRFTRRGGHVSVETDAGENRAFVRVRDDGEGIAPEVLPHVFEPFYRTERRSSRAGLGIGLAIAKYVAGEHGGALRLDSAGTGHGTTSTLELPLAQPA
jgi:signal transduction histidine kinase